MPTPITLDSMAEAALDRFPTLTYKNGDNRANAALEIVRRGEIKFLGNLFTGDDFWQVGEHVCTIKGRRCNCKDRQAPNHDGGRLCKHRLAAMFITKLEWAAKQRFTTLMEHAPDGRLTLKIEVVYQEKGRSFRLMEHHYPGLPWESYPQAEMYPFTATLFDLALRQAGWGMVDRPVRQRNYAYNYFLQKGVESAFTLFALAGNDVDRAAQEKKFDEIRALMEIERELQP